ncbi:MAG TPA: SRPBCC domain-containing protein [Actinomycetota bacterium]|jgi:uncharacterized protein YndB with AHSA1/START domain
MAVDPTTGLEIRRVLPATPEEVFRAWTDPELMARWMSPVGTAEAEVDLRAGGSFRVVMRGAGRELEHTGEYRTVEPPALLVFTWSSPFTGDGPSVVTVRLAEHDGGTELTLTHEHLPPGAAASHAGGWGRMIAKLQDVVG